MLSRHKSQLIIQKNIALVTILVLFAAQLTRFLEINIKLSKASSNLFQLPNKNLALNESFTRLSKLKLTFLFFLSKYQNVKAIINSTYVQTKSFQMSWHTKVSGQCTSRQLLLERQSFSSPLDRDTWLHWVPLLPGGRGRGLPSKRMSSRHPWIGKDEISQNNCFIIV